MLLPIRSKNPPESLPMVTCGLIAINTLIYFCTSDGFQIHKSVLDQFGEKSSHMSILTLFTSMFLHGGPMHLIGNMWFLYLFGFAVEGRLRSIKFSILYLGSGIVGGLAHHFVIGQYMPDVPSIGASGAIMGVMGAALYMFPFAKVQFFYWIFYFYAGLTEIAVWGVALMYLGLDLVFGFIGKAMGGDGVAHFAHLGGAFGGVLFCFLFRAHRDSAAASEAKDTLSETKDLSSLSSHELQLLYEGNPNDIILLNWMVECVNRNRLVDECTNAFLKALPRMIREQPPLAVGSCIASLGSISSHILPATYLDIAGPVERSGNPTFAISLYNQALRDSRISVEDEQCALFQSALLYETKLRNVPTAMSWYQELINRHPMTSWSDQARARLAALQKPSVH